MSTSDFSKSGHIPDFLTTQTTKKLNFIKNGCVFGWVFQDIPKKVNTEDDREQVTLSRDFYEGWVSSSRFNPRF